MSRDRLGVGRACPHCGVRGDTLGTICPNCRKPYAGRGLLEVTPLLLLLTVGVIALLIWLLLTDLVAAIVVAGCAFALLVAAIGVSNALAGRGR